MRQFAAVRLLFETNDCFHQRRKTATSTTPAPDCVIKLNSDDNVLPVEMLARLQTVAEQMRTDERLTICLEGYAPDGGSPVWNMWPLKNRYGLSSTISKPCVCRHGASRLLLMVKSMRWSATNDGIGSRFITSCLEMNRLS